MSVISAELDIAAGCNSSEEGELSGNDTNFASPNNITATYNHRSKESDNLLIQTGNASNTGSNLSETVISSTSSTSNTQLDNLSANSSYSSSSVQNTAGLLSTVPTVNGDRNNVERSASFIDTKCIFS